METKTYAGIDVAKDHLDVAIMPSREKMQYSNDEGGIEPDIKIDQNETDTDNGIDTILEKALDLIRNK